MWCDPWRSQDLWWKQYRGRFSPLLIVYQAFQEDEFPWIVAILREEAETADESECGGTLVSSLFVKDAFATHSLNPKNKEIGFN